MSHRCLAALLTVIAVVLLAPVPVTGQAQTATADQPTPPRTPWGAPDLQGVWDFRTLTPLERPEEFAGKAVLTAEEAAELEQRDAIARSLPNPSTPEEECPPNFPICSEAPLAYEFRIWFDRGTTVTRRTSLIVDPPDGKIPPVTPAAQVRMRRVSLEPKWRSHRKCSLGKTRSSADLGRLPWSPAWPPPGSRSAVGSDAHRTQLKALRRSGNPSRSFPSTI